MRPLAMLLAAALLTACDDGPSGDGDADADADCCAAGDADADEGDTAPPVDADSDADADVDRPPTLDFAIGFPIFEPPEDPLAGGAIESCAVYKEETCEDGELLRCDVYDTGAGSFVDDPDPLLRRALLYDRWYDLFGSPDGQTADRDFTQPMEPGTAEAVWTDPANFAAWTGAGDSAIWTGTALNAMILRYLVTGTEADYQRMEEKVRVLLGLFEVTGIPGYIARYHFLQMDEPSGPQDPNHIIQYGGELSHRDNVIENPETLDFLPDAYFTGIVDDSGGVHHGTPMWNGAPTIDQMNGPMVAFPMVYGLLRDETLRDQIAYHMTCYLKRLQRIEIINLQDNEDALEAVRDYFSGAGAELNLDPDDLDLTQLDRIVMYTHPQFNELNAATFDRSCPDTVQLDPVRVIDASSADFLLDILELVADLDAKARPRERGIDHFYIPSVRGADAMHMMHLASMAYAFTGEEMYLDFLRDELLGEIRTAEVAMLMSALIPNPWCRSFFGTNIEVGPLWAFINLLDDSPLRTYMQEAMHVEAWEKECHDLGNVNFDLMYAGVVPASIAGASRQTALDYALAQLPLFGGNGGVVDDPRRTYALGYDEVVAAMPEGTTPICPTPEQRSACEDGFTVFGIPVAGESITFECTGQPGECVMDDGLCADPMASDPLPPMLRPWADYLWQRNPFAIGDHRPHGRRQSPGIDLTEEYWMARFYDFIEGGDGQVLAWRPVGACP